MLTVTQTNLYREGLMALVNDGLQDMPRDDQQIIGRTITSRQAYEEIITMSGLGLMQRQTSGMPVHVDNMQTRFSKTFTTQMYSLAVRHDAKSKIVDVNRFIAALPEQLTRAIAGTLNTQAFGVLNLGFSDYLAPDALSMFNSAHPLLPSAIGTTTQSNTTTTALSVTSLGTAIAALRDQRTDRGLPMHNTERLKLVVGPQNEHIAQRIVLSSNLQGTSDNDNNNYIRSNIQLVPSNYVGLAGGTANSWFLLGSGASNPLVHIVTAQPTVEMWYDNWTKSTVMSVHGYWLHDTLSWRGTYGASVT